MSKGCWSHKGTTVLVVQEQRKHIGMSFCEAYFVNWRLCAGYVGIRVIKT